MRLPASLWHPKAATRALSQCWFSCRVAQVVKQCFTACAPQVSEWPSHVPRSEVKGTHEEWSKSWLRPVSSSSWTERESSGITVEGRSSLAPWEWRRTKNSRTAQWIRHNGLSHNSYPCTDICTSSGRLHSQGDPNKLVFFGSSAVESCRSSSKGGVTRRGFCHTRAIDLLRQRVLFLVMKWTRQT